MNSCVNIYPSLLAADLTRLGEEVQALEAAGADGLHIDVMDGHFVPNLTFGAPVVKALKSLTSLPLDVHLMVQPVEPFIEPMIEAGADHITVHVEATHHLHRLIQQIKGHGKRAGVSLNPATPAFAIQSILEDIDHILIMTVNPGFWGQAFILSQLSKISTMRKMIAQTNRTIDLQIDGGVNKSTALKAVKEGATTLIAGTSIFSEGPSQYKYNIDSLRALNT